VILRNTVNTLQYFFLQFLSDLKKDFQAMKFLQTTS